jgi:hypothetical protein
MMRSLVLLLSLVVGTACTPMATRGDMDIFNATVRDAFAHYDQTMVARRPALRFASGQTVHDCKDYLAQRGVTLIDEAVNNRIVAQEYLVCDAVALLRRAGPVGKSDYRPDSYGRELLRRLDLRSFPSSLRPMIDDKHVTFADLSGGAVRVEAHAVTVETDDWRYRLEVVADVESSDGAHYWLLWFSDVAKNGNYRGYQTLVVRNPAPKGPLLAQVLR